MHIPDGFLSPPVWAAFDVLSVPAVGLMARRAQRGMEDRQVPLMGVMGAFIFAAQMINFPVAPGTSGHLVGGTLLAVTLGPAAAAIVMTAILAVQALVFQDGGVIALGANIFNMAIAGVLAGYLPYRLWGKSNRAAAIFAGGVLSVITSACLALAQLLISGVAMPRGVLFASLGLFVIGAVIEGAITVAAVRAIGRLNPLWIRDHGGSGSLVLGAVAIAAVVVAAGGIVIASADPDGILSLANRLGLAAQSPNWLHSPLAEYRVHGIESPWISRSAAAMAGLAVIFGLCAFAGKLIGRQRSQ
jgi:cobalt/nickel transport system permease protein